MADGHNPLVFNGDQVISFIKEKDLKLNNNKFDYSTLTSWFNGEIDTREIGIVKPFSSRIQVNKPYYMDLWTSQSVIEVNGQRGSFEYSYDIETANDLIVVQDTSAKYDTDSLGREGSMFELVLNQPLEKGHIIGVSKSHGQQIYVSLDREVRQITSGAYLHYMQMTTNDREATYDPRLLKKDTKYLVIGFRSGGEYGTNYANISTVKSGRKMVSRFTLENETGVEAFLTSGAGSVDPFNGTYTKGSEVNSMFENYIEELGGEYAVLTSKDNLLKSSTGVSYSKDPSKVVMAQTLRLLVHAEHHRLSASGVLFQRAGTLEGAQGKVRINEGIYWQMKRAYTIQYGTRGGITRSHIQEAVEYAFKANRNLPIEERYVTFEGGRFAVMNVQALFKDEANAQLRVGSALLGTDRQTPQPVITGTNDAMVLKPWKFERVFINGIGNITVREDVTLNRISTGSDRSITSGLTDDYDYTAYSLIIKDVTDKKYTNNTQLPSGVSIMGDDDSNYKNNNVFLVKPRGRSVFYGAENGRWSSNRNDEEIVSSNRFKQESYWIWSSVAGWVKDVTRVIVIELDEKARLGYGY